MKTLEKVAQTVVEWQNANVVIYNIAKTEAVLFFKSYHQWLHQPITEINI